MAVTQIVELEQRLLLSYYALLLLYSITLYLNQQWLQGIHQLVGGRSADTVVD